MQLVPTCYLAVSLQSKEAAATPLKCCRYCKEAENAVIEFKAALQKAEANCRLISETMLLKVERKRMYDHREFAAQQAEHHVKV